MQALLDTLFKSLMKEVPTVIVLVVHVSVVSIVRPDHDVVPFHDLLIGRYHSGVENEFKLPLEDNSQVKDTGYDRTVTGRL